MKSLLLAVAVIALVAALAGTAHAAPTTVQQLYEYCKEPGNVNNLEGMQRFRRIQDVWLCHGYIGGVFDVVEAAGNVHDAIVNDKSAAAPYTLHQIAPLSGCNIPNDLTNGAITQIFINWAEQNPKQWSEPAGWGIMQAFSEAWPCSQPPNE